MWPTPNALQMLTAIKALAEGAGRNDVIQAATACEGHDETFNGRFLNAEQHAGAVAVALGYASMAGGDGASGDWLMCIGALQHGGGGGAA